MKTTHFQPTKIKGFYISLSVQWFTNRPYIYLYSITLSMKPQGCFFCHLLHVQWFSTDTTESRNLLT